MLISAGHSPADLQEYTLAMVKAYAGAIDRDRKRRARELAIILRAAQHYEPDQFTSFLKE